MAIVKNKAPATDEAVAPKATPKPTPKAVVKAEPNAEVLAPEVKEKAVVAKVTRKDIAVQIQEKVKAAGKAVPLAIAEIMVGAYEEVVTESLASGAQVTLPGFGIFSAVAKDEQERPNPQKPGEKITVPANIAPKFKPGSGLKKALNANDDGSEDGDD